MHRYNKGPGQIAESSVFDVFLKGSSPALFQGEVLCLLTFFCLLKTGLALIMYQKLKNYSLKFSSIVKKTAFLLISCFLLLHSGNAQSYKKQQRNKVLKILLISDLNDSYGSVTYSREVHELISKVSDINPDIILCGGDMVAGQSASLTPQRLKEMWAGFDSSVLTPISKLNIPFGFTVGNHDASPGFKNDREAASEFWAKNLHKTNLQFIDNNHYPYYFSYIQHNIFFISWDASSAVITEEIKNWMKQQLTSPIAQKARASIVLGHLPLYAIVAAKNKPGEVLNEADSLLDFFIRQKVDMYISGHQHVYYPASKNNFPLLHSGCLGGGPRQLLGHQAEPTKAYTIIEIPNKRGLKKAIINGYTANGNSIIEIESLPEFVEGFNGRTERLKPVNVH